MRYEIDKKNAIKVFNDGEVAPFAFQPNWPDGTAWANKQEAQAWAELLVESMTNPEAEFKPGTSPNNHPLPKPKPLVEDLETGYFFNPNNGQTLDPKTGHVIDPETGEPILTDNQG